MKICSNCGCRCLDTTVVCPVCRSRNLKEGDVAVNSSEKRDYDEEKAKIVAAPKPQINSEKVIDNAEKYNEYDVEDEDCSTSLLVGFLLGPLGVLIASVLGINKSYSSTLVKRSLLGMLVWVFVIIMIWIVLGCFYKYVD